MKALGKRIKDYKNPVMFSYVGEGYDIDGKLHCVALNQDTGNEVFYPIESKLANLK